jgi:hypothetical protein
MESKVYIYREDDKKEGEKVKVIIIVKKKERH